MRLALPVSNWQQLLHLLTFCSRKWFSASTWYFVTSRGVSTDKNILFKPRIYIHGILNMSRKWDPRQFDCSQSSSTVRRFPWQQRDHRAELYVLFHLCSIFAVFVDSVQRELHRSINIATFTITTTLSKCSWINWYFVTAIVFVKKSTF